MIPNVAYTILFTALAVLFLFKTKCVRALFTSVSKHVFACNMVAFTWYYNKLMKTKKEELFRDLREQLGDGGGEIVEIGAGTGANFQYYPEKSSVLALDHNPEMKRYFLHAKKTYPHIDIKGYVICQAEDMRAIRDNSVAAVVATLLLCSVTSVDRVLKEVIRILKPGGRFYFLEHVRGEGLTLRVQQVHQLFWPYVADGCNLTRDTEQLIQKAGFKKIQMKSFQSNIIYPPIRPHIMGYAEV